jgi:hypothetical protein
LKVFCRESASSSGTSRASISMEASTPMCSCERWERQTMSRGMLRLEEVEGSADGKLTGVPERLVPRDRGVR